jgi:arylsulfatase A-like enzyme
VQSPSGPRLLERWEGAFLHLVHEGPHRAGPHRCWCPRRAASLEACRSVAEQARRAGHRRQHHRVLFNRQRSHQNTWPDAGTTPFRSEKNTNWEGAWRVPAMVCWPDHIKAGSVSNDIMHHLDWLPTFLAGCRRPERQAEIARWRGHRWHDLQGAFRWL